jgi:two-component system LytT family sensor kinase
MSIIQKIFGSKKLQRRKVLAEKLEIEESINHFATSLIEQNSVDEILWGITKGCISKLKFVDCVVYWVDHKEKVLVQKAAYGAKNPLNFEIYKPMAIPLGKGIVGSVAEKGKAELIKDTSKDSRYIVDDEMRYSEIAVPVICDSKVVAIIDAEHPEKNFFRPKHLKILSKIATVSALKIHRLQMEEAFRQTELKLLADNKRIADAKLLALRLQMNPHFIFNSLNSINNFILQNYTEKASEYLSKFSRLIRQISANMKTEWIALRSELQALDIYLELEQLRMDNKFEIVVCVDKNINTDLVYVPPFLMQPYIENAIRHGLRNKKDENSIVKISCCREGDYLMMKIFDNGIGREAASKIPSAVYKTGSTKITEERLQILNEIYDADAYIKIDDLYDDEKKALGTEVTFSIKIKNA